MGTLTVRENLRFSAALRLHVSVPQSEKEARVNHLIKELGLTKVADSKVDNHILSTHLSSKTWAATSIQIAGVVFFGPSGGHTDDPGNLRRGEEENKHRNGAHH